MYWFTPLEVYFKPNEIYKCISVLSVRLSISVRSWIFPLVSTSPLLLFSFVCSLVIIVMNIFCFLGCFVIECKCFGQINKYHSWHVSEQCCALAALNRLYYLFAWKWSEMSESTHTHTQACSHYHLYKARAKWVHWIAYCIDWNSLHYSPSLQPRETTIIVIQIIIII